MNNFRFKALEHTLSRQPKKVEFPKGKTSDYFGANTFNSVSMREFLSEEAYKAVVNAMNYSTRIDRRVADQIAASLKAWAISKNATHYTHWFQPLTGATAEKHDAFFTPIEGGRAIENFQGNQLIQQEPDASSFPNGGIRNTFEARGYTAWDPTSPAFVYDKTLCIPTIFISYTGEALDYKTPLLKALSAVDKASVDVCKYFDKKITKVNVSLGWEQEYFLVDTALYNARPDLMITGRTLFGHSSAKDQQLDDHYFGSIPERVTAFMKDFEIEAYKLGIPVKTRHNEVAPNQFECAPVYEEANLAVDHNQLLMHLLEMVAKRHDFVVLLHEKPYAKVNGSGKHNNWSLLTNTGVNLLSPGKDKMTNYLFIVFFVNILKAVHEHSDLLRAIIASAGNDLRLGGNEAPPSIISAFIGSHITKILDDLEKTGKITDKIVNDIILNISKIPEILLDNTDRNRTSPFAFTGNKFEFRAVGSAANCAKAMLTLNTILADQLIKFKSEVDKLISQKTNKTDAILKVLVKYIKESKPIRFEGNSYSDEWKEEAKKRGLSNVDNTADALKAYITPKTRKLFVENNVLTERELLARYEIQIENYTKKIQIESRVTGDLAINHIIPVAITYQNKLIQNVKGLKDIFDEKTYKKLTKNEIATIKEISNHTENIKSLVDEMLVERKKGNNEDDMVKKTEIYKAKVLPFLDKIRYHVDKLENLVDDELWPLPKYRELLLTK